MGKTIEEQYLHLEHRDQILLRPDSTIGTIITEDRNLFVADDINDFDNIKIVYKNVKYNPGFFKIIDEILTNASDHFIRTGKVKYIKINIEKDNISIENDGPGIPVVIHKKEKVYLPEMLFGNTFTSENYDDSIERTWGGRNGIGAKSTNIFSKKFIVETADGKKKYYQEFSDNMAKKTKPVITKLGKNYTKITFYPDFERFGLTEIDDEIKSVIFRRCLDITVYCQGIKVYFNGNLIPIKNFKDYMKLFVGNDAELFTEKLDDKWEIGISKSFDGSFNQVSMVNGLSTYKGGTHVNYIINQLTKNSQEILNKKYKNLNIKPNDIKNNVFLFVNSKIVNPTFDEQSKETLTSKINSNAEISEKIIKQFTGSQIVEDIIKFLHIKEEFDTKKEIKKHRVKISKLDEAKKAGTSESYKCKMIFCEGDSAVNSVIAGLSNVDSAYWGIFPLRGKVANPRELDPQKVIKNEEIKNIINILGLEYGKKYTDTSKLRYGKIVLMADADPDGNHIRGLLINLFDVFWPELLKMDFLYDFTTPIIKASKGNKTKYFYNQNDYIKSKEELKGWNVKWLKGLATLEPDEMKLFFKDVKKYLIRFHYDHTKNTEELIDLTFNKKRADDRKEWMKAYSPNNFIDKFKEQQTYDKFINNELMEFSMVDNNRMIPSMVDGFKPVQRKIMYIFQKDNINGEIKVSSLSGAVINKLEYHNGDDSCNKATIGMAQNFVGSNNINLLVPKGNFGSRLKGGSDAGSPRYIFTKLNDITHHIFKNEDLSVLSYNDYDGKQIEPFYFVPIIPMVLINGSAGIGYGYSTFMPSYNPNDIITYLQNKIKGKKNISLSPYYKDFRGEIIPDLDNNRYISRGTLIKINDLTYEIKELPLWLWNDNYYEYLDDLMDDKKDDKGKLIRPALIRDWSKNRNDKTVDIKVSLRKEVEINDVPKLLKMDSYIQMNNMHLFDANGKIKKYNDPYEIIDDFYKVRMEYYVKRKNHQIEELKRNIKIHQNKIKFLKLVINDEIVINKRSRELIEKDIEKNGLERVDDSYNYLLNMYIVSFTKEKLQELKETYDKLKEGLVVLEKTPEEEIWLSELAGLKSKMKL